MIIKVPTDRLVALLERAAWLAYEASAVVGMGIFQAQPGITSEQLLSAYPLKDNRHGIDYGFGRMMKYRVDFDREKGIIKTSDRDLSTEYESWHRVYKSYAHLFDTAADQLGITIEAASP